MRARVKGGLPPVKRNINPEKPTKVSNAVKWVIPKRPEIQQANLEGLSSRPVDVSLLPKELVHKVYVEKEVDVEITPLGKATKLSEMTPRAFWSKFLCLHTEYHALLISKKHDDSFKNKVFKDQDRIEQIIDTFDTLYPYIAAIAVRMEGDMRTIEENWLIDFTIADLDLEDVPDEVEVDSQFYHKHVIRREL